VAVLLRVSRPATSATRSRLVIIVSDLAVVPNDLPRRGQEAEAGENLCVTSENSADAPFRFTVDAVFSITGRGTAIIGFIEAGTIRVGDMLRVIKGDGDLTTRCKGVESVRQASWTPGDPVPVGLLVDLARSEVKAGDVIAKE
jgi:translation elongation factor EF-Tu-like GTPase